MHNPLTRRRLLGAGTAALALAACKQEAPAAQKRGFGADGDLRLMVEGVPMHAVQSGEGPVVVLVHGASGNLNDMTFRVAPALARSHRVVVFDRPGHGASGWPDRGIETFGVQVSLMRGALAQMDIARYHLIGHSYGGSLVLAWALAAPEEVASLMVLSAPSQVWEGGLGLSTDLLANPLAGPILARVVPPFLPRSYVTSAVSGVFAPQEPPPGYLEHVDIEQILQPQSLRSNALQLNALKSEITQMVPRYPSLAMPVEILHGVADRAVPIEIHSDALARDLPAARLSRLEGIGHMLHQVALPEVEAALARLEQV